MPKIPPDKQCVWPDITKRWIIDFLFINLNTAAYKRFTKESETFFTKNWMVCKTLTMVSKRNFMIFVFDQDSVKCMKRDVKTIKIEFLNFFNFKIRLKTGPHLNNSYDKMIMWRTFWQIIVLCNCSTLQISSM